MRDGAAIVKCAGWLLLGLLFCLPGRAEAGEPGPSQVKDLVRTAVRYARNHELADTIKSVNDPTGPLSRGPLRIFILDMKQGLLLADPLRPDLVGGDVLGLTDFKGKKYYRAMAAIAREKGSGWSDHFILPPGGKWADIEAVYVESVPGTEILIGCGLFDMDAATAEAQTRD